MRSAGCTPERLSDHSLAGGYGSGDILEFALNCTSLDRKPISALNETVAEHYQIDRYRKPNQMHDVLLDSIQQVRIMNVR